MTDERRLTPGMHDNRSIYPMLPPKDPSEQDQYHHDLISQGEKKSIFLTAWEYRLTHEMTDKEAAAFWTGVGLVHEAMAQLRQDEEPTEDED